MTNANRKQNIPSAEQVASDISDPDVKYLAEHSDLSPLQAADLIKRHGRDRDRLMKIARTMKAEG